jgi:hypothetical protein
MPQGEWKGKGAAGSGPSWINNPQYSIAFADPVSRANITLSTGRPTSMFHYILVLSPADTRTRTLTQTTESCSWCCL